MPRSVEPPAPATLPQRLTSPAAIDFAGPRWSGSAFSVDVAASTVAASVADAAAGWTGTDPDPVHRRHALAACSGWLELDGQPPEVWADFSGYYTDRRGRAIQLHCNFPHHAAGVLDYLGLGPGAARADVAAAIGTRDAFELEADLMGRGMIAAAQRTLDEWTMHSHAQATATLPVCTTECLGDAVALPHDDRPLRVLDFSRVLAGPVCGQTLAGLGADVLRVGAAHLPSVQGAVVATGFGKRNAFCDLGSEAGRSQVRALAAEADVVVDAYRPGSLEHRGFGPADFAASRPGMVVVQISAFDWVGPWAGRRGFDSIVQTTSGISHAGAAAAGRDDPTPLPFQALDYCTGYFAAASALHLLAHQRRHGGSWLVRLSLLRTRNWLVSLGGPTPFEPAPLPDPREWALEMPSGFGLVRAPRPLVGQWSWGPRLLGSSSPEWAAAPS